LDRLAYEVNGLADGDTKIGLASGFDVVKSTASAISEVTTPTNLMVKNADAVGTIKLTWMGNASAVNYGVEYQIKGEDIWKNGTYSTSQSAFLSSLPSGAIVFVKIRALGRKQMKSDWTEAVSTVVV
jgi:DNA polymerase/3'-5' exonuclease PolX